MSCFNDGDVQTYQQLKDRLQVNEEVLKHALKPLVYGNRALLKKEAKNLKWDVPTEKVKVNLEFANNAVRVALIPKGQPAVTKQDPDKLDKQKAAIDKERFCVI